MGLFWMNGLIENRKKEIKGNFACLDGKNGILGRSERENRRKNQIFGKNIIINEKF